MKFENDRDKARFLAAWHWQYQYTGEEEDLEGHKERFKYWSEAFKTLKKQQGE